MFPVGAIFVPFSPKTGTKCYIPAPPIVERVRVPRAQRRFPLSMPFGLISDHFPPVWCDAVSMSPWLHSANAADDTNNSLRTFTEYYSNCCSCIVTSVQYCNKCTVF